MPIEILLAGLLGGATFGTALLFVAAFFVEKFGFRNHPPTARSFWTTFVAWLIVGVAWAAWAKGALVFLFLLPAALIHFFWYRYRLQKQWDQENQPDIFE